MARIVATGLTAESAARLQQDGPVRDILLLARSLDAETMYAESESRPRGLLGKLFGAHVRQAWRVAGRTKKGDTLFTDSEQIGLPLLFFLAFRWRRPANVIILAHLPGRVWKLPLLWLGTRLIRTGTIAVHSVLQKERIGRWLGSGWKAKLIPYQVDERFWKTDDLVAKSPTPLLVAVGSEHRDYAPLIEAVRGMPVRLVIAAGSHWARQTATTGDLPDNVRVMESTLPFQALQALYAQATAVVVPVRDIENQSGITTILEAMSMSLPVITTASKGQREAVRGPLICPDGSLDRGATSDRGPALFDAQAIDRETGMYVPPGNAAAMRHAIQRLLDDRNLRIDLGRSARQAVLDTFTVGQFAERFGRLFDEEPATHADIAAAEGGRA